MSAFSRRDWIALALIVAFGVLGFTVGSEWLAGLIFPVAIWVSVLADRKKASFNG